MTASVYETKKSRMSLKTHCAKCTTVSYAATISLLWVVVVLGKVALRVECQQTNGMLEDDIMNLLFGSWELPFLINRIDE